MAVRRSKINDNVMIPIPGVAPDGKKWKYTDKYRESLDGIPLVYTTDNEFEVKEIKELKRVEDAKDLGLKKRGRPKNKINGDVE